MKTVFLLTFSIVLMVCCNSSWSAEKVVVIPLNGNHNTLGKVWGEGRVGSSLMTMATSSGYCSTTEGINFSISSHLSTWNAAPSVCPAKTWVCRASDIGTTLCPTGFFQNIDYEIGCNGQVVTAIDSAFVPIWLSDAGATSSEGLVRDSDYSTAPNYSDASCTSYFVYCCWN